MLFLYYLHEIKYRFYYCIFSYFFNFIISFYYIKEALFISVKPLLNINKNSEFSYFIFTDMVDVLFVYIKISFIISIVCVIPFIFIQVWFFLLGGLFNYEKFFLFFILIFSVCLFSGVVLFLYNFMIPFIWFFFVNFELTSINSLFGIYYEARINDYIDFMFYIFFIFCCLLQLPVIMVFLIYYKVVNIKFFIDYRKYFIITMFILGGVFSPPDIFSQLLFSSQVLILFELVIIFVLLFDNYKKFFRK